MKNSINEAMKGLLNATLCEIEKNLMGMFSIIMAQL